MRKKEKTGLGMSDDASNTEEAKVEPDAPPRDTSQLLITDWERREVPATADLREKRFQVVLRQSVLNQVHRHGLAANDIEICGVLVGNVYHDSSGVWLYVEYAIEGNHAAERAAQVTFTADTWAHIQSIMDRDYPEKRILGWYHTHPGFGIFLSDMDVFIQENFFPEAWQVAFVYDPKAAEEGAFVWKNGKPQPDPFLVEADAPTEELTKVIRAAKTVSQPGVMGGDISTLAERLLAIEKRQKWILALLALVGLLSIGWPIAVTMFLPDLMQGKTKRPPIKLQNVNDDPTSRPSRVGY